ncbi:MAG TPA: iron-containing alcohol dehydrogenase, partial [Tepidisphaeraceae bacterium]
MMFSKSPVPTELPGSRVRIAFGAGNLNRVGEIAKAEGATRVLLVSDPGITKAGHVDRAVRSLYKADVPVRVYDDADQNPTTEHVRKGLIIARPFKPDLIIGLGGGSAMDCAKGINFLLTNGGRMQDYWGVNKATQPMLPFIAIPTTAGTGSDAQSFALITDPETHQKMACGDVKALPRVAILDPELIATVPPGVAAATGIDAVAHAVETAASLKRNETSRRLSREAWDLLEPAFERVMLDPNDAKAREQMLLGSHIAGAAIENSMLGAAHSCANALTALCDTVHGVAVGLMLPHVVRFNAAAGENPYSDLMPDAHALADRLTRMLTVAGLPKKLSEVDAMPELLPKLAAIAAKQWTATF